MLVSAQPLLASTTIAFGVPPRGPRGAVAVDPTGVHVNGKVTTRAVNPDHHNLSHDPVAVLTGPLTASAGEITAIAFRSRLRTRFIGMPTAGVPTGNAAYRLRDGAVLNLTVAQWADRTGHVYPDAPLEPDQRVTNHNIRQSSDPADPTLQAAEQWLSAQPSCRQ